MTAPNIESDRKRTLPKVFRPEIEGVRAVAALLVASYHIWSGRVSGGVDVFFVVSGFLITMTLFGHFDRFGRIRPAAYLARLLRRLLPAALTVLLSVLLLTWILLPSTLWDGIAREIRASALYFENWQLAWIQTDYLASFSEKTPVQHFWAMSVQGQFYVMWLVVFLVIGLVVTLLRRKSTVVAAWIFGLIFVASLAYSIWFTAVDQPVAYFSSLARVWEFALGGLAAIVLARPLRFPRLRWVLGWLGLLGMLSTGLLFQVSSVFPGYAALLPTISALLILASAGTGIGYSASGLLGHRALVWLGGISYGIYLWHWPILVYYRYLRDADGNGLLSGLAIIAAAIVMAWLTSRLIERPLVRLGSLSQASGRFVLGCLAAVLALVVALTVAMSAASEARAMQHAKQIEELSAAATLTSTSEFPTQPCAGASAALPENQSECGEQAGEEFFPHPSLVHGSGPSRKKCEVVAELTEMRVCARGASEEDASANVLLIGDSHADSMGTGIEAVALHNNWRLFMSTKEGCTSSAADKAWGSKQEACRAWLDSVEDWVADSGIDFDLLLTINSAGREVIDPDGEPSLDYAVVAYQEEFEKLAPFFTQIAVLRDTPQLERDVVSCVERNIDDPNAHCSLPRDKAEQRDAAAEAVDTDDDPRTVSVRFNDVFCGSGECVPVIGGVLAYFDRVHVAAHFSLSLAPILESELRETLNIELSEKLFGSSA